MKFRSFFVTFSTLLFSIVAEADDGCNYSSLSDKEFQFREVREPMQKFGYGSWTNEPLSITKKLDYSDYVGKKGKVQENKIQVGNGFWYVAVLETCEKVYTSAGTRLGKVNLIPDLENHADIYFLDSLRKASTLVGKKIWVNFNVRGHRYLFAGEPNKGHPLTHLEALEILALSTKPHGSNAPFYLLAKKQSGETGDWAYNEAYFFLEDPIDPKWDIGTAETIKLRKIILGMSEQQLLLSKGKPERINKTVDASGVREQWVYGLGEYAYMENGMVTSFQSSR